jgi:hypothetical protein
MPPALSVNSCISKLDSHVSSRIKDEDITFLETIPIALSVFLWVCVFKRKKIAVHVNLAVVSVELEVIQISKSNEFVEVYSLLINDGTFPYESFSYPNKQ